MNTTAILNSLGVRSLDQIPTAPNYPFSIVLSFSALASGATVIAQDVVMRSKVFVLDEITGTCTADNAVTGSGSITALTVSTGGTSSNTLAAFTPSVAYAQGDFTPVKDSLTSLGNKVNELISALGAANYGYPAASMLSDEMRPNAPSLARIGVKFFSTRGDWQSNYAPWPTMIGTAKAPRLPMFKPTLSGGNTIGVQVQNGGSVTVSGVIVLHGRYVGQSA